MSARVWMSQDGNLVASNTRSRRPPASARPTKGSLCPGTVCDVPWYGYAVST